MAKKTDIELKRRTTKTIPLVAKNRAGEPYDLTDCTIVFVVKADASADDSDAVIRKVIPSNEIGEPTSGLYTLVLTEDDTDVEPGNYVYEFGLKNADGDVGKSRTGAFQVEQDVGHETA